MEEIIKEINKKRKKDINGYITVLVLDLIMWGLLLTVSLEKFLTIGIIFSPVAIVVGLCLRAELRVYNHPEMNRIYRTLSYVGNKEAIDRYVDSELASVVLENEFLKITPELIFNKKHIFNIYPIKDVEGIVMKPTYPSTERSIFIYIVNNNGSESMVFTGLKATSENLSEINRLVSEMNQKLLELKDNKYY